MIEPPYPPIAGLATSKRPALTNLRPLEPSDVDDLFALTHANRDHLRVWLPWVDKILRPEDTQSFVDNALQLDAAGNQKHYLLMQGDAIMGTVSLVNIGQGQATVGYWIAEAWQGRGHITSAVQQLKALAFDEMGIDCLHLEYLEGNAASARVAAKCGFTVERVVPRGAVLYGRELDRICCIARKPPPQV